MIFSPEQVRAIRQRKLTAALVPAGENLEAGRVRVLRREARCEACGGTRVEVVSDFVDGERVPSLITIIEARDVDLDELSLADARVCGYRTVAELREWWRSKHPRAGAQLVRFAPGDVRDMPRLLSPVGFGTDDYTTSPSQAMRGNADPGEAISKPEQDGISQIARQRDVQAAAEAARQLEGRSGSERLARIQALRGSRRN